MKTQKVLNSLFAAIAILSVSAIFFAFAPPPSQKLEAGFVAKYGPTTNTNSGTVYHTITAAGGETGWFWRPVDLSIQINANETSGSASQDLTLQTCNDLDSASPTWIDVWSPAAWTADEDTIITVSNVANARYRLKWVGSGTGVWSNTSWLIVKE